MNAEDTRIFLQQLDWIPSLFLPVSEVHQFNNYGGTQTMV